MRGLKSFCPSKPIISSFIRRHINGFSPMPLGLHDLRVVDVRVEELEQLGEVDRVTLVRRCRRQDQVPRLSSQELAQLVSLRGPVFVTRHVMGFIHDDQVPRHGRQSRPYVWLAGEGH